MPDKGDRSEIEYSDDFDYSIGTRMNDRGHVDHQQLSDPKYTSAKSRGDTGLITREKL